MHAVVHAAVLDHACLSTIWLTHARLHAHVNTCWCSNAQSCLLLFPWASTRAPSSVRSIVGWLAQVQCYMLEDAVLRAAAYVRTKHKSMQVRVSVCLQWGCVEKCHDHTRARAQQCMHARRRCDSAMHAYTHACARSECAQPLARTSVHAPVQVKRANAACSERKNAGRGRRHQDGRRQVQGGRRGVGGTLQGAAHEEARGAHGG